MSTASKTKVKVNSSFPAYTLVSFVRTGERLNVKTSKIKKAERIKGAVVDILWKEKSSDKKCSKWQVKIIDFAGNLTFFYVSVIKVKQVVINFNLNMIEVI